MGQPGQERTLTISSAVWIQYTNVTDRQTDTGRQQRLRLHAQCRAVKMLWHEQQWSCHKTLPA